MKLDGIVAAEDVRKAYRVKAGNTVRELFNKAQDRVGAQEFSSAGYLGVGALRLLAEFFPEAVDIGGDVLAAPMVRNELIAEYGTASVRDIALKLAQGAPESTKKNFDEAMQYVARLGDHYVAVADYCNTEQTSPEVVINTPEIIVPLHARLHGSVDAYVSNLEKQKEDLADMKQELSGVASMPMDLLIGLYLSKHNDDLESHGLDPRKLSGIASRYIADAVRFGEAFLDETIVHTEKEIEKVRAL